MTRQEFIGAPRYFFYRLHDEAVTEDGITEDGGRLAFVFPISCYIDLETICRGIGMDAVLNALDCGTSKKTTGQL
jgi:hypothetical protein